jgi:hypothetical protein
VNRGGDGEWCGGDGSEESHCRAVTERARERERDGWLGLARLCKFYFTAGWRVIWKGSSCTRRHGAWEIWMNNTKGEGGTMASPHIGSTFFC